MAYEYTLGTTPFWSLFGDGTLIVPGPQIEIYPGPALPNLTATPVSEDGIQAILQAARDAGLMDGDANYGDMCIADAATTVFTTTADGSDVGRLRVRARRGRARRHLRERQGRRRAREAGGVPGEAHRPAQLAPGRFARHRTLPTTRPRCACTSSRTKEIPNCRRTRSSGRSSHSLDAFGEAVENAPSETRCGVVSGEDLTTLLAAAKDANALTPWTSGGTEYQLIFRPLLPDEHAC